MGLTKLNPCVRVRSQCGVQLRVRCTQMMGVSQPSSSPIVETGLDNLPEYAYYGQYVV